ncbi:MAG: hypothetical protein IKL40_02565 [Clostridia bacterium]|nr:hypothetical protein [Clostridia bacterium]
MRTKIFVAIILLICMTLSLTSCFIVINHKDGEPEQTDAPTPTETEQKETKPPKETFAPQTDALEDDEKKAEELMSSYWDNEYEGKIVITIAGDYLSLLGNEESGTFSRAMGLRNELVTNTFDCEIEVQKKNYATFFEEAVSAKNAGLFYSDLVIMPYSRLGEVVSDKLLCNLADYCDYDTVADTVDKNNMTQLSAGNNVLAVVGDALFFPSSYLCVYYNKTLANTLGIDALYDAVDNGDWTIGRMTDSLNTLSSKLGEGYYCISSNIADKDVYNALFTASGMRYMNAGKGVTPSLVGYDERTDRLIEILRTLDKGGALYCKEAETDKRALFEEGKSLFYIGTVAESLTLNNNFGMLPLPKLDSEQDDYYTYVTDDAPVMCVLNTATDPKKSVDVINGYNDASAMLFNGYMRDFLDFYARDSKSAENLRRIVDNKTFDFANAVSSEFDGLRYATSTAIYEAVTQNKNIKWHYNTFRGSVVSEMTKVFPVQN